MAQPSPKRDYRNALALADRIARECPSEPVREFTEAEIRARRGRTAFKAMRPSRAPRS